MTNEIIIFIFTFLLIVLFSGCSTIEYREAYIPVKCNVEMPKPPNRTGELVNDVVEIFQYTEILEHKLDFCINDIEDDKIK